jgi:hypothetical protein
MPLRHAPQLIFQKINITFVLSRIFNKFAVPAFAGGANFSLFKT